MKLKLIRETLTPESTIGSLYIEDKFQCFTLEDTIRAEGVKVKGKTAIPPGIYTIIINYSNRFKRDMPLLLNVPMFDGIRIHSGNDAVDTEGCILVGKSKSDNQISLSRIAFRELFLKLQEAKLRGEDMSIEVLSQSGVEDGHSS